MEFRILGPLTIVDDGGELPLRAAKQRALLALLLLHRNEAVPSERLIDWLWSSRPPATAQKSLQVYISELRKLLGEGRLETQGRAYLLHVSPGELDLDRFEGLVEEARGAEAGRAADLLSQALDLYAAEPLPELRYDEAARSEIGRPEELRLHTVEARIDAELALGRQAELIPEIEALVAAHPLRERLRWQQMLALYRCGRQADALSAYRQARQALDQELGLEPGPALRQLERRILEHDPELNLSAPMFPLLKSRPSRRRLVLAGAGGGTLVLGAAIAATAVVMTSSSAHLESIASDSVGIIDPRSARLVGQVPVGSGPVSVAVGNGAVWVANAGDQTVSRIDARTKRAVATIGTGHTPSAIAVGPGAVWVANPIDGNVTRIEPQADEPVGTVVTQPGLEDFFAPPAPSALAVGNDAVWANSNPRALIVRFSPISGAVQRQVFLGRSHSADGIAVGAGAVWISSSADDTVLRLDPRTGHVKAVIPVAATGSHAAGPYGIAVGDGSVWVADSLADTVSRIDPRLQAVTATIRVGLRPTNVAVGEGAVWVVNRGDGTVSRIDARRNTVTATIHVGGHVTAIAAGAGAVWVTVAGGLGAPKAKAAPSSAQALPASSCSPIVHGRKGRPRYLIASDLPRYVAGQESPLIAQMRRAIVLVLEQHRFRAGPYTVGYQACDDSSKSSGVMDPVRCVANARAYAGDASVLGVVGTFNSPCAAIELPITNTSPSGPLATISADNTYVGLTTSGPATTPLEPDVYYPSGVRSYARLAGNDQAQGAADALLAKQLGLRHIYLLDDGTGTAAADATYTGRAAARLGVRVVGRSTWRFSSKRYLALAGRIAASGADGVYIGGCLCANGRRLLRDIKAAVGRHVVFFAADNAGSTDTWFGAAPFTGLYQSVAGEPVARLDD